MKNTIKLSHKELVDLIVESIVEVKEQDRITSQEQFREMIKNIEKLYGPKKDNSKGEEEVREQRIGYDTYFDIQYGGGNSSSSHSVSAGGNSAGGNGGWWEDVNPFTASKSWYHFVIDGVSLISYLLCGLSAGVGCVVSVIADICNALLYIYTKDDYYSAGMQIAFAIAPFGEVLKYSAKPLKAPLTIIFKAAWNGTNDMAGVIAKAVANLTPKQLKVARQYFPKSLAKELSSGYNTVLAEAVKYYTNVPGLKSMMTGAGYIIRALVIFIEMCWYDPEHVGGLLKLTGDWLGFEKLTSWGEAMEDWPKWGVKLTNKFYTSTGIGGFRALVQTSIADCNNTVYVWEYAKEQYITQNNIEEINFDEDKMEADWWNGWRPIAQVEGGKSGRRRMPTKEDTVAMELIKDEYNMYAQYAALKECKKMTEGKTYGPWLTSCSKFKSIYTTLNPKERFEMLMYFIDADSEGEC